MGGDRTKANMVATINMTTASKPAVTPAAVADELELLALGLAVAEEMPVDCASSCCVASGPGGMDKVPGC